MTLTEGDKGSELVTSSVVNLFVSQIGLKYYATYVYFQNIAASDSFKIIIFVNDPESATERIYDQFTISDDISADAVFIPFLPTDSYRVTAQKITGTDRSLTWVRYEN